MSTLGQISTDVGLLKKTPRSTPLIRALSSPESTAANADFSRVNRLLRRSTPAKADLDARIAAEELALAALIHANLMSVGLPCVSYACLKGKTVPCSAIGGDFFDAIALKDSIFAVVADVSGKGVPAAIVAAMLQGIIHAQMLADEPLESIAGMVNQFLCSRAIGKYATMVLLKVRADGSAEYLNCGHVPPVLVNGTSIRRLERSNVVVGLIPGAQYTPDGCELIPGDRILIFTDGVTETENATGDQFGDLALASCAHLSSLDAILDHVSHFQGGPERHDDWTLFELLYRGANCSQPVGLAASQLLDPPPGETHARRDSLMSDGRGVDEMLARVAHAQG